MRTALFTGFDEPYEELASLTTKRMALYANRHGMQFHIFTEPPAGLNIYWTGVARALELLRDDYDRVFYLDVDQLITGQDCSFAGIPATGFHASRDWGNDADSAEPWRFSMCGFLAHQDCIALFEEVLSMEPEWRDKPFQEQGPFQDLVRRMMGDLSHMRQVLPGESWRGFINIHQRRTFNCVPDEVSPGNVPEPWQPGDFAAHLTMLPMEERLKLARKFC